MEGDCVQLLRMVCQEDCAFPVRKKALLDVKNLLGKMPSSKLAPLAHKISFTCYKPSLVATLLSCGDHEFQEYLIELLARLARPLGDWKNVLKSWFYNFPPVVDAVDVLESKSFDVKCRTFLNLVNESSSTVSQIHSLLCLYAAVTGKIELQKPAGYDELWIDCSPCTGDIQLLVDGHDGSWARVVLQFEYIRSIKCRHRKWRLQSGDVESSQLLFKVQPSIVLPFETPVLFSEVVVVLKKDLKFQELEIGFLKVVYASCYEPDRANLGIGQRRKTIKQSSTTTSFTRGRSAVPNGSSVSVDARHKLKRIVFSAPVNREETGDHTDKVDAVDVKGWKNVENIVDASTSPGHRSSISSERILILGKDAGGKDDVQQEDESTHFVESSSHELCRSEASAVNLSNLEDEVTNERLFTFTQQSAEEAPRANSQTVADRSPIVEGQSDGTVKPVEVIGGAESHEDRTSTDLDLFSIPSAPTCQYVFGAKRPCLVDFKALQRPHPAVTAALPLPQSFGTTFSSKFRKPVDNMSGSEKSLSSCSTKISLRNFRGVVQLKNPTFDLSHCSLQSMATKACEKSVDPFRFGDEIGCHERVFEDVAGRFRIPSKNGRKKRKLYTPGKDDVLHSDDIGSSASFCDHKNNKLRKINCTRRRRSMKRSLHLSNDEIVVEDSPKRFEKQMTEETAIRRSSRLRKKVDYKEISSGESGVSFRTPRDSVKLSKISSLRKTEPPRSEGRITSSHPMPYVSVRPTVDVDLEAQGPPEPAESSPPHLEVGMDYLSPSQSKPTKARQLKIKSISQKCVSHEPEPVETSLPLHVEMVPSTPHPKPKTGKAKTKENEIAEEGDGTSSKAAPQIEALTQSVPHKGSTLLSTSAPPADQPMPSKAGNEIADEGDEAPSKAAPQIAVPIPVVPHKGSASGSTSATPAEGQPMPCNAGNEIADEGDGASSKAAPQIEVLTQTAPHKGSALHSTPETPAHQPMPSNKAGNEIADEGDGAPSKAAPQSEVLTQTVSQKGSTLLSTSSPPADQSMPSEADKMVCADACSISQVHLGDCNDLGWANDFSDLIVSQIKAYVDGMMSDDASFVESIQVNFTTCLEALRTAVNSIREDFGNVARSTANVQSACDAAVTHVDVVLDKIKAVEGVHCGSAADISEPNNTRTAKCTSSLISNNTDKR